MYIDPKQLRLLASIAKKAEVRTNKHNIEDIKYFRDNGLVICTECDHPGDYFLQAQISEKGKAFLYETKHNRRRTNIALCLSIIAILISLLTAFTPFSDWSRNFISSMFQTVSG